jgi:hypothetical protein
MVKEDPMQKLAFTLVLSATFLCATGWSQSYAGDELLPGWYGTSLLVYGNPDERYAAGCLRWHWQVRSWYDHCGARKSPVVAKY